MSFVDEIYAEYRWKECDDCGGEFDIKAFAGPELMVVVECQDCGEGKDFYPPEHRGV